ncbi:MAG: sulfotransferase [Victivallaceae bacterium]
MVSTLKDEPCFLIGHPRSGTTFLHRFILNSCNEFNGLKLEDMLTPAMGVFLPLLRKVSLNWLYDPDIHETSFQNWETDDIALGLKYKAGYLSWLYFKCRKGLVSDQDFYIWFNAQRERNFSYLLKIYLKKRKKFPEKRFLSKSFIGLFFLNELAGSYKDAKFVLLMRNPLETVPSTLSLMEKLQTRLFSFDKLADANRQTYFDNVYNSVKFYYARLDQIIKEKVNSNKFMLVSYKKLNSNFADEFKKIAAFYKIDYISETKVAEQDIKQKERHSKHIYNCANYGIDEDKIHKDFAFIMENYEI